MTIVEERIAGGFVTARRAMIDSQLRTSGVNEEYILRRMDEVPRERFVPPSAEGYAYIDRAIALGNGRYLAAPVFHGLLLQQARPTEADRALVVDGGSGYLPELLRPLVGSLETVDADAALESGGDGDFTLLLVDGAVEQLPGALTRRLAEGARAVTGWVRDNVTCLAIGRKAGGEVALLPLTEMGIPILRQFDKPKGWSF